MIETVLGLILLLSPFLFITKIKEKELRFAYIISIIISINLSIALITQAFKIFSYKIIFILNLLVFVLILFKTKPKKLIKAFRKIKIDPILIYVIIISFICLYSVHYDYKGKYTVSSTPIYQETTDMKYPYPYYADEWYSIAFIKYNIKTQALPLKNPLMYEGDFRNFEFTFHSFLSEIFLLLDIDPLEDYTKVTILFNMVIVLLVYFLLRKEKISKLIAGISSLSTLFITSAANLPGIWTLIPITLGLTSFLLSLFFYDKPQYKKIFYLLIFLTILFYPPLIIFQCLLLIFKALISENKKKELLILTTISSFAAMIILLIYVLFNNRHNLKNMIEHIFITKIFYISFTGELIPNFLIHYIIPIPVLIFSLFGIFYLIKNKRYELLSISILGLLLWSLYFKTPYRFVIEQQRVIFFTSIMLILVSGFGMHFVFEYLKRYDIKKILFITLLLCLISFSFFTITYTKDERWINLTLLDKKADKDYLPAAPANRYLHEDDLLIFKDIRAKKFLSIPWKGTVIGVSTGNMPLSTKQGTISNQYITLQTFLSFDCEKKYSYAKENNLFYVYSPYIECDYFKEVARSSEGFILYKRVK